MGEPLPGGGLVSGEPSALRHVDANRLGDRDGLRARHLVGDAGAGVRRLFAVPVALILPPVAPADGGHRLRLVPEGEGHADHAFGDGIGPGRPHRGQDRLDAERLRARGKPAKVVIVAVMRKPLLPARTFLRTGQPFAATARPLDHTGGLFPPEPSPATTQPARTRQTRRYLPQVRATLAQGLERASFEQGRAIVGLLIDRVVVDAPAVGTRCAVPLSGVAHRNGALRPRHRARPDLAR